MISSLSRLAALRAARPPSGPLPVTPALPLPLTPLTLHPALRFLRVHASCFSGVDVAGWQSFPSEPAWCEGHLPDGSSLFPQSFQGLHLCEGAAFHQHSSVAGELPDSIQSKLRSDAQRWPIIYVDVVSDG